MTLVPSILIVISEEGLNYPSGKEVHPNDKVTFAVEEDSNGNVIGDFTLVFDPPNCFTSPGPYTLNADHPSVTVTVSSNAKSGAYWFSVERLNPATIPGQARGSQDRRRPPSWEVKRGDVDVSTDPGDYEQQPG